MHGLILHQCSIEHIGGVETYFRRLIESLQHSGVSVDVKVITPDVGADKARLLFKPLFFQQKIYGKLKKIPREYDFVLTRHPYFTIAAKKRFAEVPVIFIPPGNIHRTIQYNYEHGRYSRKEKIFSLFWSHFLSRAQKKSLQCADFVIYFSDSSKRWIDPYGITRNKSMVSAPGVAPFNLECLDRKIRNQVLFVGRLVPAKNSGMFLDIAKKNRDFRFVLVGEGIDKTSLLEFKAAENLDHVIFAEPGEAQKYFEESSIFILPSMRESFGHVVVEAFNHGLPVLGLRPDGKEIVNSNSELINAFNGALFNSVDEVRHLLERFADISREERTRIMMASVNRFNMASHTRKMLDMIKFIHN